MGRKAKIEGERVNPNDTPTIRINKDIKEALSSLKQQKKESYSSVIRWLISETTQSGSIRTR